MTYKVSYHGYAFVEADSEEEAKEMCLDGDTGYEECEITDVEEWDV